MGYAAKKEVGQFSNENSNQPDKDSKAKLVENQKNQLIYDLVSMDDIIDLLRIKALGLYSDIDIKPLDVGVDSKVFEVTVNNKFKKILKIYKPELKINNLAIYRAMTKGLMKYFQNNPPTNTVDLDGEQWDIKLEVVSIEHVLKTKDEIVFTLSPMIKGKHFEELTNIANQEINNRKKTKVNKLESLEIPTINNESLTEKISIEKFNQLFQKTFYLLNKDRLEVDICSFLKTTLGIKQDTLHPKNIKPFIDSVNKRIVFKITDVGDVLTKLDVIMKGPEQDTVDFIMKYS